ncbi:hypothetical protein BD324DRAFT_608065 [Kockovaella imperatae]|uniref:D-xylose 1-dehydrogenase (NADP(+), D-xylono-1,5-lactone-forming) n=1 Tax=Kockovaella imperatae TaxID=4999 RepID=A0A1Y1UKT8_9TREE|nr:hypothetical protein BD324DRAFT_608065 [Kockovaella imperatae]ORX38668.1 hypothetical protein BD324DRAFT_608065 [Kockovaella imperatae]
MSSKPFVAQWGVVGCGWISSEFVMDITRPTSLRKVSDVSHALAAVGSRSLPKAEDFISKYCPDGACGQKDGLVDFKPRAYGSYKEVADDPNVNIVYVGTMNTSHYDDAKMALEAGKHCLLEKPATLNAAEWKDLSGLAKSRDLFLMEAVWTRFNPVMLAIQQAVHIDKVIGDVHVVRSDHSMDLYGKQPDTHRCLSADLAGGPMLDVGPYPMVWSLMMLFRHPKNDMSPPEKVAGTMLLHSTGVDLATGWTMTFPKIKAIAYCTTNLFEDTDKKAHTRIVGSEGEIVVQGHTSRPVGYTVRRLIDPSRSDGKYHPDEVHDMGFEGFGLSWEADQVARCLKAGLTECPTMLHKETQMTMEIFDKLRLEGGYHYLPGLERIPLKP